MVIWVTGLSGAGKTSLCEAFFRLYKPFFPELVLLDGDAVREIFGNDLGYAEADRVNQVKRLQRLAGVLSGQGLLVMVAVVYSQHELLHWNRQHFHPYFEVYLKASLKTVRQRDAKGLYAKAAAGTMKNVVGLDIPWQEPLLPDLVIDMNAPQPPEAIAADLANAVPWLAMPAKKS